MASTSSELRPTKYVVEQARRHLALQPPGVRRRTVERLAKAEVERFIAGPANLSELRKVR